MNLSSKLKSAWITSGRCWGERDAEADPGFAARGDGERIVCGALRAHDDRFNATVNQIELNKQRPDVIQADCNLLERFKLAA